MDSETTKTLPETKDSRDNIHAVCLTIVYHPDFQRIGERAILADLHYHKPCKLSRFELDFKSVKPSDHLATSLLDPYISRKPMVFEAKGNLINVKASQQGSCVEINGEICHADWSCPTHQLIKPVVITLAKRIVLLLHLTHAPALMNQDNHGITGYSDQIIELLGVINTIGPSDSSVLIRGETGCGKELVARAIHQISQRSNKPLISVNMSAITPSLAASELFGHCKGAFTGAGIRKGYFREAHNGSLFLDEIGDTPREIQAQLLRVLDQGEVQPVGGSIEHVNVRLIAATDADLEEKINEQSFSMALFNRLSHYEITIPPLRHRKQDIGLLVKGFICSGPDAVQGIKLLEEAREKPELAKNFASMLTFFCLCNWLGNVRQLKHAVDQIMIDSQRLGKPEISKTLKNKLMPLAEASENGDHIGPISGFGKRPLGDISIEELRVALKSQRWDLSASAKKLGISRAAIYKLIDQTEGIHRASDISSHEIETAWIECQGDFEKMVDRLCVSLKAVKRRVRELNLDCGADR